MPRMHRGNVVLTVKDHEVKHYLNLGYNLTSSSGSILQAAVPRDMGALQVQLAAEQAKTKRLTEELEIITEKGKVLEVEVERLREEVKKLKARKTATKK